MGSLAISPSMASSLTKNRMLDNQFEYQQVRRVTSAWDEEAYDDVIEDGL